MNRLSTIITDEKTRECLLNDLLSVMNNMGVETPYGGYIDIEYTEQVVEIIIPIEGQSGKVLC